jgi:ketol-acid reductoisomerase
VRSEYQRGVRVPSLIAIHKNPSATPTTSCKGALVDKTKN